MTTTLVSSIFRRSDLDNAMLTDPVSKFRVSQPQTLIDTDFEYGLQSTKWETIELINNIPVFFSRNGDDTIVLVNVESTNGSDIIKVTTNGYSGFNQGSPFIIQGLKTPAAEGSFVVSAINIATQPNIFYYRARELLNISGSIYDSFSSVLFSGRVYQSTQYNKDLLVDIKTNLEDENTSITVTTKFPHGFKINSAFTLANSTGIKKIPFDASLVEFIDILTTSNTIAHTNSNNESFSGFLSRNIIPYDWGSKKTFSFIPDDINLATSGITIPSHGQTDSLAASNLYYYTCAPNDTPVGGLSNNTLYGIKVLDANTIQFANIKPKMSTGVGRAFAIGVATNTTAAFNILATNTALQTTRDAFNIASINYGTNTWSAATNIGRNVISTTPGATDGNFVSTLRNTINMFYGYFKPPYSGTWFFRFHCFEVGHFWFGDNAVWNDAKPTTPDITIPFLAVTALRSTGAGVTPAQTGTSYFRASNLVANHFYPYRILTVADNNPTTAVTTVAQLFASNAGGPAPFNNFTNNLGNTLFYPSINKDTPLEIDKQPITLYSKGTSNYGSHFLQKAYYLVGVSTSTNELFIGLNSANYSDAPLSTNNNVIIVPSLYSSNISWFNVNNILHNEKPTTGGTAQTAYSFNNRFGENFKYSYCNISKGTSGVDYKYYLIDNAISINSGTTGVNNIKNTIIKIRQTSSSDVIIRNSININDYGLILGPSAVIPAQQLNEYDSIYYPLHGYSTGDSITLTNIDNTKTLPGGLIDGRTYTVSKVNDNFFRLNYLGTPVDITSVGDAIIKFTKVAVNPNADTFFVPNHGLIEGVELTYYNDGNISIPGVINENTYYAFNVSQNRFKIASNLSFTTSSNNLTNIGEGTHYFLTGPEASDGNFKIISSDAYSFTLSTQNTIPYRTIKFYPPSTVNQQLNAFYLPNHRISTGNIFSYSNFGADATDAALLTTDSNYYAIRLDGDYIRIAGSYNDAINNNAYILPYTVGDGSNHFFNIQSINGEKRLVNTLGFSNTTQIVSSFSNFDLQSLLKIGDTFTVEVPLNRYEYFVASNTQSINAINLWHIVASNDGVYGLYPTNSYPTLKTGDAFYHEVINNRYGGLSNQRFYYIRKNDLDPSSKSWFLYNQSNEAIIDINRVVLGNPGTIATGFFSKFTKIVNNSMFNSPVVYVNSPNNITLEANPWHVNSNQTIGNYLLPTYIFPRADGYNLHRAYDGGVEIIPPNNPDSKLIRQTRRFFRYQSGKGIQCSKAINFNAATDCLSISRNYQNISTQALIKTRFPHRLTSGANIRIIGADDENWNSSNNIHYFTVTSVPDLLSFTTEYPSDRLPSGSIAGGFPQIIVKEWVQSALRAGMFDDQNGLFFEYDGTQLYACRRNSTTQLPGYSSVTYGSSKIVGDDNSLFTTTLIVEDKLSIKGQTYKVVYIESDSVIYVQPTYRGVTNNSIIMTKIIDTKVAQENWSIDKCDGNGPTGFNLDTTKIQMIYLDYSWYGAGKVRFGFKANNGEVRYVHEFIHNNNFNEAYLRSGNLPGRYEVENLTNPTYSPSLMHWGTSIIMDGRFDDDKAYLFTAAGKTLYYYGFPGTFTIITENNFRSVGPEGLRSTKGYGPFYDPNTNTYVNAYRVRVTNATDVTNVTTLKAGTLIYASTGIVFGTYTYSSDGRTNATFNGANSRTATILAVNYSSPTLAYIFIDKVERDTSTTGISELVLIGTDNDFPPGFVPLASLRLGPSVDNGRSSSLGVREIINRMQINLDSFGVLSTHDVDLQVRLNAYPYYPSWQNATSPSLSQVILHDKGDSVTGGTTIYNVRIQGGPISGSGATAGRQANATSIDLSQLLTLGNSILGGDGVFPDGPDILTIGFNLLDNAYIKSFTPMSITGRLTWKESQA